MRGRQINSYFNQLGEGLGTIVPPQVTSVSRKPLSISLEEIAAGKITYVRIDAETVDAGDEQPSEDQPAPEDRPAQAQAGGVVRNRRGRTSPTRPMRATKSVGRHRATGPGRAGSGDRARPEAATDEAGGQGPEAEVVEPEVTAAQSSPVAESSPRPNRPRWPSGRRGDVWPSRPRRPSRPRWPSRPRRPSPPRGRVVPARSSGARVPPCSRPGGRSGATR